MPANTQKNIEEHIGRCYSESEKYTAILSSICRQLAFAEGALFWFLRDQLKISDHLVVIGFFFLALYFICDAIQYLVGYVIYFNKAKEWEADLKIKMIVVEDHYNFPPDISMPIEKILYAKLVLIGAASIVLLSGFIIGFGAQFFSYTGFMYFR